MYFSGCKNHIHGVNNKTFSFGDIERLIKDVFNKDLKSGDVDPVLFRWQVRQLVNGLQEGYGEDFISIRYNEKDSEMVNKIKENVFVFSAFKNYQELRAMSEQLIDADGNTKTWKQFRDDVMQVHETYDQRFLEPEFGNAVVSASMMRYWDQIQKEKGILKLLRFNAIIDGNSSTICPPLDKTTRPVDDPFWDVNFPPLHWGPCRSTVDQLADGEVTDLNGIDMPEISPMFRNNVGKTGIVFPEKHPYFQTSKKQGQKLRDFANKEFKAEDGK